MNDELEDRLRRVMAHHDDDITENPWSSDNPRRQRRLLQPDRRRTSWDRLKVPLAAAGAVLIVLAGTIAVIRAQSTGRVATPLPSTTRSTSQASSAASSTWWSRLGPYTNTQTEPIKCGVPLPNFTVLGPDKVGLTFSAQSSADSAAVVRNQTDKVLGQLASDSDLIVLDPDTLDVIGQGSMNQDVLEYQDVDPGQTLSVHFLGDPRDCESTTGTHVPDGTYPAFLRVQAKSAVGIYLIPVLAQLGGKWAVLAAPTEDGADTATSRPTDVQSATTGPPTSATEASSTNTTPTVGDTGSVPAKPGVSPYLAIQCGQTWTAPTPSASLDVQATWPATISNTKMNRISVTTTNTGPESVSGIGDTWFILLIRNGKIVSIMADGTLVGHPRIDVAPGAGRTYEVDRGGANTCEEFNVQPLPLGQYQAIFGEQLITGYSYSEPTTITVVP